MRVSKLDAEMTKELEAAITSYKGRFLAEAKSRADGAEK